MVAIFLAHLSMNVEAKEIQSGNLAAQKLDSFNCNLSEESVKAVNFWVFHPHGINIE